MGAPTSSRRDFLASSTTAAVAATSLLTGGVFAAGSDTLKVGLIGCGGRGTGAAKNALLADPNVKLTAMGDAFSDRLQESLTTLKRGKWADRVVVTPETSFVGFDAYQKVLDSGVDVVLLCTPPHFRPLHLRAAVEAKKHIFCEKPLAVDCVGIRSAIESAQLAKKLGISLMSGFCYRYDYAKRETIKRIHDGAIGDVLGMHINYNTGPIWYKKVEHPFNSMEYQMRNWYYFTWLSGDHIVEQHVHNMDKASWVLHGQMPIACTGVGGRAARTAEIYGNIYDHHAVTFEYANGLRVVSVCRQMDVNHHDVSDHVTGSKGYGELMSHSFSVGGKKIWKFEGEAPDMYQTEHNELFAALRAGKIINDGESAAHSTMMAIMGRMANYTGEKVTWDFVMNKSRESLMPPKYDWGVEIPKALSTIAVPGQTKLI
jgi:predicted dehydrogenase